MHYSIQEYTKILVSLIKDKGLKINWLEKSNWLTGPVSIWHGVKLDHKGRVIMLWLFRNILTGTIPLRT